MSTPEYPDDEQSLRKRVKLTTSPAASAAAVAIQTPSTALTVVPHDVAVVRAEKFVKSILTEYEPISALTNMSILTEYEPISALTNMSVLGVVDLITAKKRTIVVRDVTEPFWQACIDMVDESNDQKTKRVCATGTPGIGKTVSSYILIRMLLMLKEKQKEKPTVVCIFGTEHLVGYYYEFKPNTDSDEITITLYPERNGYGGIASLMDPSTYYIVDSGSSLVGSNPMIAVTAKVIIISSPNERHWGTSFYKQEQNVAGYFKYYPLWTLQELQLAHPYIGLEITSNMIEERYRQFGGVPRHVFEDDDTLITELQDEALNQLTKDHAIKIAQGKLGAVTSKTSEQPKSALIGYERVKGDDLFRQKKVVEISALVAERIYNKFIKDLWQTMLDLEEGGWKIFEAYSRELMVKKKQLRFEGRVCAGTVGRVKENLRYFTLGGCEEIRLVHDIVECAKKTPKVVFYAVNSTYPLIDFIYQDDTKIFHAFQVTMGRNHRCDNAQLSHLKAQVGDENQLHLYYLVPAKRFKEFVTSPVSPRGSVDCEIWHLCVVCPEESHTPP